jgi:uncharacterized membrane protein
MRPKGSLAHLAYLITITVKGFDGLVELCLGLLIVFLGPFRFYAWVLRLTAPELDDNPDSALVMAVRHGATRLAQGQSGFAITYLLIHGLLKLGLAVALLRGGGRILFPVAALVFSGFIAVMAVKLSHQWSNWLLSFALFDFATLLLVLNEWRQRSHAGWPARR